MTFLKRNQELAISAILLAACGDIDFASQRTLPDISGNWTFEAFLLEDFKTTDDGILCDASGYRLVIDQNEGARSLFTGTYSDGRLTCVLQGDTILDRSASGTIVNGVVGAKAPFESAPVEFDFDTRVDAHHEGFLGALSQLGGSAKWSVDFGGDIGRLGLSGSWGAPPR